VFALFDVSSGKSVKASKMFDIFRLPNDSSGKPVERHVAALAVETDSSESVRRNGVLAVLDDSSLDSSGESVEKDDSGSGASASSIRCSGDRRKRGKDQGRDRDKDRDDCFRHRRGENVKTGVSETGMAPEAAGPGGAMSI
jgi:hypothetical protein